MKSLSLADRVVHEPLMCADDFPFRCFDIPGLCRQVLRQEIAETSFANEADPRAVFLVMGGETGSLRKPANLRLVDITEWKEGMGELVLVEQVEKIGLVLVPVSCLPEQIVSIRFRNAGVVAGGDFFRAQIQRIVEKSLELDLPVAEHIRIGCAPCAVFVEKVCEDPVPVFR